jgi:hypothetical protein
LAGAFSLAGRVGLTLLSTCPAAPFLGARGHRISGQAAGAQAWETSTSCNPKDRQTLRALGTAIGFILVLSITGSVMAQDQRGTDALPLVVKPISGRDNPLHVEQSTEWPVFYVALGIGVLQLIVFGIQSYLLWDTVLSSNLPKIIVRRIVIESPNIDNRPVTQPFRQNDKLRGRFTFINVGRRKATIAETYSMFFITDKALPMNPLYDDAGTYPLTKRPRLRSRSHGSFLDLMAA